MCEVHTTDWRELCEAASREHDPEKLMALVQQLNAVLEEQERESLTRLRHSN
jgi:hypothetical protein